MDQFPLTRPHPWTWPATQACALTGNGTDNLSVCRLVLNPLSHTSQGAVTFLYSGNSPLYLKNSSKITNQRFDYWLFLKSIAGEAIQWIPVCLRHRSEGTAVGTTQACVFFWGMKSYVEELSWEWEAGTGPIVRLVKIGQLSGDWFSLSLLANPFLNQVSDQFIYPFSNHSLDAYSVPGHALGTGDLIAMNCRSEAWV